MLNEKAIDKLIQPLIDRQTQIEMAVIEKIAKRLGEIKNMLPSDVHKLETLLKNGSDAKEINKILARSTQMQEKEIKKVIKAVAQNTYEDAKPFYDYRNLSFVPFEDNEQLQKTIKAVERATLAEFDNLSNATAFMKRDPLRGNFRFPTPLSKIYQKVVDTAIQSVVMGPESYNEAIPKAIKELVKSGIKTVEYTSDNGKNHYVRLDTAVRRNILDGIRNISHEVDRITGEQFGADGVELSVHNYSAPDHEPIQGHRFTNEEFDKLQTNQPFEDENGNSFAPIERPIGVWNCHHIIISVILEAMSPAYTKEQLEQIIKQNANGYTYTNKKGEKVTKSKYWCTQKMREYELDIKKAREGKKAAELAKEYELQAQYQAEISTKQNEYRQFCEDCGLEPEFNRTRIYTAQDEVKGVDVKNVDKSQGSGIIKSQGVKIMNINSIDSPIEQRNTGKGNPNAILTFGRPLNKRQSKLISLLTEYNSRVVVPKKTVNMRDLSALTAHTGDEFALFTKGNSRLVIRGNSNSVNVDIQQALELSKQGFKWSGHTHPGVGLNCLQASTGDREILSCFKQKVAYIYNSQGEYLEFWRE